MKNKILTCIFATGLVLGLAACGGVKGNANESKVLEDTTNAAWVLHGNFILADGETVNNWNGKDNELYEASKMTAISIKEAKEIDAAVGEKLASKKVKYLYKYEGAVFGKNDAGYSKKFLDAEKNLFQANGSYVFKAATLSYDAEEEVYAEQQWIPDPKVSHAESLDGNMFFPTWSESFDEDGFSWADDNVIRSGAGVYTIIVAQYDVAVGPQQPNFGIAAVKTSAIEDGIAYVQLDKFVPANHTYGVIGLNGNWGDSDDIAMTLNEGVYKATVTATADTSFKVRADGHWDYSWGFASVDADASTYAFTNAEGNIGVAAGTFDVELTFSGVNATIVLKAASAA